MSRVLAKRNRSTELRAIEIFRANGITGWRRNVRLSGKPDFVFRGKKVVIFVDGCFWHGCSEHGSIPKNNRCFWKQKLTNNKVRDIKVDKLLRSTGWRVLRIWQHELPKRNERALIRRIRSALA